MQTKLALVVLAVQDLERAGAFYEPLLGWSRTVDVPVYREYQAQDGLRFGLYRREGFARNTGRAPVALEPPTISGCELYLYVDRLEKLCDQALSLGAELLSPAAERPWGDRAAYLRTPEGHVLVLAERP